MVRSFDIYMSKNKKPKKLDEAAKVSAESVNTKKLNNKDSGQEAGNKSSDKKWDNIYKPTPIVHVTPKYNYSLPFNHGHYNEFEHLNTYSTHNYIPVTNRVNMLFPNVGTMANVMKRR